MRLGRRSGTSELALTQTRQQEQVAVRGRPVARGRRGDLRRPEGINRRRSRGKAAELHFSSSADDSPTQTLSTHYSTNAGFLSEQLDKHVAPLAAQIPITQKTLVQQSHFGPCVWFPNWKHFHISVCLFTGCLFITILIPL